MFPHVYMDIGLGVNHAGVQSEQLVAEMLEVAPFRKILFSSDAWGLPELHLLGSWLFRRGLSRVLGRWVAAGDWSLDDARPRHRAHRVGERAAGLRPLSGSRPRPSRVAVTICRAARPIGAHAGRVRYRVALVGRTTPHGSTV